MALIIDGYNLLHASGILGRGVGPGSLERSRQALLNFLAEALEERELATTTVVFDAREAPPGLPRVVAHRGITVRFAEKSSDADEMIEELIKANTSPRKLVVVSSDHRLHRAARRRKARAVDSDEWYAQTLRQRLQRFRSFTPTGKPAEPATENEVRFWMRHFGEEETSTPTDATAPSSAEPNTVDHPFPPGYAEDIGENEL